MVWSVFLAIQCCRGQSDKNNYFFHNSSPGLNLSFITRCIESTLPAMTTDAFITMSCTLHEFAAETQSKQDWRHVVTARGRIHEISDGGNEGSTPDTDVNCNGHGLD